MGEAMKTQSPSICAGNQSFGPGVSHASSTNVTRLLNLSQRDTPFALFNQVPALSECSGKNLMVHFSSNDSGVQTKATTVGSNRDEFFNSRLNVMTQADD